MISILNDLWNLFLVLNYTALLKAVTERYTEIVELLLKQEDIDINMKDILSQIHSNNSNLSFFHMIYILSDLWNFISVLNYTALILAALNGYTEIVELLLKQERIDINLKCIINIKNIHLVQIYFVHGI